MPAARWKDGAPRPPSGPGRWLLVLACLISAIALLSLNFRLLFETPGRVFVLDTPASEPEPEHEEEVAAPEPASPKHTTVTPAQYTRSDFADYKLGSYWPSWSGLDTLFIFGDSWTTTGFDVEGEQPTHANPFGNPPWSPETWHQTNGENWVKYLTVMQNSSFLRTVNIAYGGATVDRDLISPDALNLKGLKYQIEQWYMPNYVDNQTHFAWTADTSLFTIWIGLNDIHNADNETSSLFGKVWEEYASFVDELYQTGAKNFMFMNIPPIHRSPLAERINTTDEWREWVWAWNQNVTDMAANLTETYADATVFVFDTYKLFDEVIDDGCSHDITCRYEDTTTFCWAFAFGAPDLDTLSPNCPLSADKYLWMNDLHPTSPMYNLTAHEIAKALSIS